MADSARTGTPQGFSVRGDSVVQGDSIPRLQMDPYYYLRNWSINPPVVVLDTNADHRISARELNAKNSRFHYTSTDFVSQIVMSSSFGIMQPLHVGLIDYAGFGSRNPETLFDPNIGIEWGSKYFSKIWYSYVDESYAWEHHLRTAIGKYNGGPGAGEFNGQFTDSDVGAYADSVIAHINDYKPAP